MKLWCFRPLMCTLFRLNWANLLSKKIHAEYVNITQLSSMQVLMYACTFVCTYANTHQCTYIYMYACIYTNVIYVNSLSTLSLWNNI